MQKFIENCGFFLKEMKMKLMIRNTSDDDDKIDSTQDEGNDDDTTGTGGKMIYIYKYCNNKWVCTENQQAV